MPLPRLAPLLLLALAMPGGAAAEAPTQPATMVDAIAQASGSGWSTVTLADGRPMALYRTESGAVFALGCRADGLLVIAGGPDRAVRLGSYSSEVIYPIALDRVGLRGARRLAQLLRNPDNPRGDQVFVGTDDIASPEAVPHVGAVAEHCSARLARSRPPELDTLDHPAWSGSDGMLVLAMPDDEQALVRLECDERRRLSISVAGAPRRARAGQQATIVVGTPIGQFSYRASVGRFHSGPIEFVTTAVVGNGSVLLTALSMEDGFATGFGTSIDTVRPTQGLAGLIERRLSACR